MSFKDETVDYSFIMNDIREKISGHIEDSSSAPSSVRKRSRLSMEVPSSPTNCYSKIMNRAEVTVNKI